MIMQKRVAISLAVVKQQLLSEELCAIGQWMFIYRALFFLKVILYTFFLFLLIYCGLEVGVLVFESWIGFLGLGLSLHGVWGLRSPCGVGPLGFWGLGLSI